MKPIKKFSMMSKAGDIINESAEANHDAVMDLVKKMGYESIDELKKEKNLLSKLESLLKDVSPKQDISEDELEEDRAEDIEDTVKTKDEPKSLEAEELEEDSTEDIEDEIVAKGEPKSLEAEELEEDSTEDIEDEIVTKSEPKSLEDTVDDKVSDDSEITAEVPAEADEVEDKDGVDVATEEEETPAATKRIMAFEDFIKEKEVTVNKNIKYSDDAEEPEDYSVVVASNDVLGEDDEDKGIEDEKKGDELEDKGDKKVDSEDDKEKADHYKGAVKSDDSEIDALKKDVEYDEDEEKKDESRIKSFSDFVTEAYVEEEDKESVVTEAKFVKDFNRDVLKATTKEEVLELYPNAEFFIGSSNHFFGELDENLFFKAYYTKGQKEFEIKSVYSEKNKNYVHLYNESVEEAEEKGVKETFTFADAVDTAGEDVKINEKDITSDNEFKEYAMSILKSAFGDDFDEAKATEVADGLLKKYGEDYGAMVGALQSTMGS